MELICSLGVIEFRLANVEHGAMPEFEGESIMLLQDGTVVQRAEVGSNTYLVIDYRTDPGRPARIEFWEALRAPEYPVSGLLTLCEAYPGG